MGRCCGRQSRDKPALETFLEQATKFNLTSHDLYKQAVALKKRMEVHACMHAIMRVTRVLVDGAYDVMA